MPHTYDITLILKCFPKYPVTLNHCLLPAYIFTSIICDLASLNELQTDPSSSPRGMFRQRSQQHIVNFFVACRADCLQHQIHATQTVAP